MLMGKTILQNDKQRSNLGNLALTLTHRCQMKCRYCSIETDRRDINEKEAYQAIDLLLTSPQNEVELQFFGGEPLLRFDLIQKAVGYAQKKARNAGKTISYLLTTNGLLLSPAKLAYLKKFRFRVLLSIDGMPATQARNRPLKKINNQRSLADPAETIALLRKKRIDFFVNLVFTKQGLAGLSRNVAYLVRKGAQKIQLSYAIGSTFKEMDARAVCSKIEHIFRDFKNTVFFGRFGEHEPIMATPQITVDSNADIYRGCALVLERRYPGFNRSCRVGSLKNITGYSALIKTHSEQTEFLLKNRKEVPTPLLDNLYFGLALKKFLSESTEGL